MFDRGEKGEEELEAERLMVVRGNFKDLQKIVEKNNFTEVNGVLLDLGVSSRQLDEPAAGFGFQSAKLDMRFDKNQTLTAEEIINRWLAEKLAEIFRKYGEERLAKPIVREIVAVRKKEQISKPQQLMEIVQRVYHRFYKKPSKINPATKVFQALRIAVNDELGNLEAVLPQAVAILKPGGRLAVVAYHSLEDKIVKEFFKRESKNCLCPPEFPICQCNHQATLEVLTKKPVMPTTAEIAKNPRARSAKMRVGEKIRCHPDRQQDLSADWYDTEDNTQR